MILTRIRNIFQIYKVKTSYLINEKFDKEIIIVNSFVTPKGYVN